MVAHAIAQVEHIDHGGDDSHHALIHGGGGPGGPAALGATGDHELLQLQLATLVAGEQFLHAVHGANGALGHGQAGRPGLVAGLEILVPGEADQVVLGAVDAVPHELKGLVGDHLQLGGDTAGGLGDGQGASIGPRWWLVCVAVGTAPYEQESCVAFCIVRLGDHEPVLPDRAVDLGGIAPGLGNELDHKLGGAGRLDLVHHLPRVGVVWLLHIPVEGGFRSPQPTGWNHQGAGQARQASPEERAKSSHVFLKLNQK